MQTEKQKFLAWIEREKKDKGLLCLHVTTALSLIAITDTSDDEAYRALNEMNAAVDAGLATPLTGI